MNPNLAVTPGRALNDEPVEIQLSGLLPHSTAKLYAQMVDDFGREWKSQAAFVADGSGVISPSLHAPMEGTYESVDPMGLFWSMVPAEGRMVSGLTKNGVAATTVILTAEIDGQTVAESKIERLFVAGGVERVPVRDGGLVGTLFLPAAREPLPGVLVFTGSGGGFDEGRAALLASHGFVAFALAYFNADGLPDNLIDIPLEYFETGLGWMASRPEVDGNRIGVTGQSRGGELVLLLASIFPSIRAVVAGVPSAVVWGGFGKGTDEMQPPPVAWTRGGEPVPAMPGARGKEDWSSFKPDEPIPLTPGFLRGMEDLQAVEMASIPVERSQAAIMMVSGEADAMWPSAVLADMTEARLHRASYAHPVINLKYPNAGQAPQSSLLPLYLAHGVTTVRDTGGSLTELALLRQGSARGDVLAPRVFFVGPLLDGLPPLWPNHTILVDTVPRARAAVRMLVSQNADCIKIYNSVPEESLIAIVEEAHTAGLLVLGHVPRSISMSRAVTIGMDCLEHIRITGRELLSAGEADEIDYLPLGTRETLLWDRFELESDGMERLIRMLANTKVFLDPTLIVDADMFAGGVHDGRAAEVEEQLPEPALAALRKDRHLDPLRAPEELKEKSLSGFEKRLKFIDMCNAAGVRILAGTDVFGPGALLPGASLHNELALLQRAGLSPVEVLRAATITAAAALRRESDLGSLEKSKLADVVVLDADPLADARNARSIRAIVKDGLVHTPSALIQSAAGNGHG